MAAHLPAGCTNNLTGAKRLRRLEDTRLNLQMAVLTMLDQIGIIEDEIQEMGMKDKFGKWESVALEDIATYEREEAEGLK